jgi:MFS family permease
MENLKNHHLIDIRFNAIVRILTFSDVFLWGGYYMMNALVAIYLEQKIQMNSIETIAVGFSIYLIARSLAQIPIAEMLDKHKSFVDETWCIVLSCFLGGLCIISYIFITQPWHLYLIQFIFGIAVALNLPAWRKAMAKFIDKGYEAVEYSLYDIINSLFIAALTSIGGYIVQNYGGFEGLFIVSGIIAMLGGFVTMFLLKVRRIHHEYK